jgi:predicted amidophosphoribosyltransferase
VGPAGPPARTAASARPAGPGIATPEHPGTPGLVTPGAYVGLMLCLACTRRTASKGLCPVCWAGFSRGGQRRLAGGVLVRSAYDHRGTARLLVHRLKYGGHAAAAALLAEAMVALLPTGTAVLVPVPRARLRRWRYGVDPALELARALGRRQGVPVAAALAPEWWHRRRAGPAGVHRGLPRFRLIRPVPGGAVLVDDVVTTGATLRAAAAALGRPVPAVTATSALRPHPPAAEARRGYSDRKPPSGEADDGSVRAARSAPSPDSLPFPSCPPPLGRAPRPHLR